MFLVSEDVVYSSPRLLVNCSNVNSFTISPSHWPVIQKSFVRLFSLSLSMACVSKMFLSLDFSCPRNDIGVLFVPIFLKSSSLFTWYIYGILSILLYNNFSIISNSFYMNLLASEINLSEIYAMFVACESITYFIIPFFSH